MLILFWVYKSRINRNGLAPIMMRITCNGKRISFSINLFVEPKSWDQDKQKLKGNSPLSEEINKVLMNYTTLAWNAYND
jgi:integrase/recombinase XerD